MRARALFRFSGGGTLGHGGTPMRANILIVLLSVASTSACAKDLSDWNNLNNTKKGTNIQVVTLSGERVDGEFTSVSDIDLRLNASAIQTGGLAYGRTVLRTEVREVYKVPAQYGRHMSGKTLLLSSLAGMAVGIGIGEAVDQAHPSAEDPGQGKLIGGVLGIFLGPAAAG